MRKLLLTSSRIFVQLGDALIAKVHKFLLAMIEKKEKGSWSNLSYASALLASLKKVDSSHEETYKKCGDAFGARVSKDILTEKPDVKTSLSANFIPESFELLDKEYFATKIVPEFAKFYKRNSSNVPLIHSFVSILGPSYVNQLPTEVVDSMIQPKIFETMSHKTASFVEGSFDTFQFYLKTTNKEAK